MLRETIIFIPSFMPSFNFAIGTKKNETKRWNMLISIIIHIFRAARHIIEADEQRCEDGAEKD